jgi:glutaminase
MSGSLYTVSHDQAGNTIVTFATPGLVTSSGLTLLTVTIAPGNEGVAIDQPALDALTTQLQGI